MANSRGSNFRSLAVSPESSSNTSAGGFTMLELLAVVAIMAVLMAMAAPSVITTVGNIRARSSAEELAGLMQQARAQAARRNRYYSIVDNSASLGSNTYQACIDLNWNGSCDAGEPLVEFARGFSLVTSGGPSTAVITCGPSGPTTCPAGYTGLNFSPQPSGVLPAFNARGLPCAGNPPTTQPNFNNNDLCYTTDQSSSATTKPPIAFVLVYQYNGVLNPTYSAIAVTPAGRITCWTYAGKDGSGNDVWAQ